MGSFVWDIYVHMALDVNLKISSGNATTVIYPEVSSGYATT